MTTQGKRRLEVYEDEWGTYWVPFFNVTADEAKRQVRRLDGDEGVLTASVVRGRVVEDGGEPVFRLDPTGPDQMWQVVSNG